MRVLITFTGFNDPYSKTLVEGDEQPGPILSLLAAKQFDRVILHGNHSSLESGMTATSLIGPRG